MPWASSNNTPLDRTTNERKVSKHIKKLMSCWLIREDDGRIIDITQLNTLLRLYTHKLAQVIETTLLHLLIVNNESIIKVSTLYKIMR